jgi:hypothetical protein
MTMDRLVTEHVHIAKLPLHRDGHLALPTAVSMFVSHPDTGTQVHYIQDSNCRNMTRQGQLPTQHAGSHQNTHDMNVWCC